MSNASKTPAVRLGQYKGLSVTRHLRPVTDSMVEQELLHQCRAHTHHIPSDQPAHRGSRVTLDFEGFFDGEPIPNSRMTGVTVVLGTGKLMPAAEQAIYGHCAGETFRFDFTYPEDFRVPELSGQTAEFEIRLHAVAEKSTPAPSDELAKACGHASLEEMKQAIRDKKLAIHKAAADRKAGTELLEQAGWNLTATLNPERLDAMAGREMERLTAQLKQSGISLDSYCENSRTTPEKLRQDFRRKAEGRIRAVLAARAIAEAEKITVSHDEIADEYRRLSAQQNLLPDQARQALSLETVEAALTTRKVQEFLLAKARVTTVEDPEPENQSQPNEG